jgi:hypothetical protein
MEIAINRNQTVSAFQPHAENFYHWCAKRNRFSVVEHRGFICESETVTDAMADLLKMVRSQNEVLSNRMLDSVKFKLGV